MSPPTPALPDDRAVSYTVTATLPSEEVASEYLAWLEGGHVEEVIRHGARSATIVRLVDPAEPIRVETRYVFPTRALYEDYITRHAPTLRADGLRRFGPDRGVSMQRRVGWIV